MRVYEYLHMMRLFAGDRGRGRAEGEQVSTRGLRDHRAVPFGAAAPISTGTHILVIFPSFAPCLSVHIAISQFPINCISYTCMMTKVEARARSLAPSCQLREQQPRNQKRPSGTDRVLSISQTLNSISAEKNSTIIFPLPIDFI